MIVACRETCEVVHLDRGRIAGEADYTEDADVILNFKADYERFLDTRIPY